MAEARVSKEEIEKLQSELMSFKEEMAKKIEGIKTTMEILQDKESMQNIDESEKNREEGKEIEEFEY